MTWDGGVVVARTNVRGVLPGLGATVSPTGRLIAVGGGAPGPVQLWDLDGSDRTRLVPPQKPCGAYGTRTAFSPDGSEVAVAAEPWLYGPPVSCPFRPQFGAAVWQVGSRAPRRRIWTGSPGHVELGRAGGLLVDGRRVWSTSTGVRIPTLDGTLALSRDGRRALVSRRGAVSVVAVPSGHRVAPLRDAGRPASALFSPDGRRVLTSHKGALDLWDGASGRRVVRLGGSGASVKAYAFGAGGKLVRALFGRRAATFDAATGKRRSAVAGEFSALSPDGSVAVSLPLDGTVKVVDLKTGLATGLKTGTANPITAVHFGPNADTIIAEDAKGSVVRVVRCPICASDDELLRRARATLAVSSSFHPRPPPISYSFTG